MKKRTLTDKNKSYLKDVRKTKKDVLKLLYKTENLKDYQKLIKALYKINKIESKTKSIFKKGLRHNM